MIRTVLAAATAAALAGTLSAQTLPAGYATSTDPLPAAAAALAVVDLGGDRAVVRYDNRDLVLDQPGQPPRLLLQFPQPRFASFTRPLAGGDLLFAESSFDEVWVVPTAVGGTPRQLAMIPFAYDAVPLGPGRALVSARTGGFTSAVNDLIAVDIATGAQTAIGFVPGASGPVTVDANGDLLYATAPPGFPPPPGTVEILRWSVLQWAAALASGPQLTRANAQLVRGGIDAAGFLIADPDDDLIYSDWVNNQVVELDDVHGGGGDHVLLDYAGSGLSPAGLVYVADPAAAAFEPFALPGGGALLVQETDFAAQNRLRWLRPQAAALSTQPAGPVPQGVFALALDDAPPQGLALLTIGAVATGYTVPLRLPGFEQTAALDIGMLQPLVSLLLPLDAAGSAVLGLSNPGFAGGLTLQVQAVFAAPQPAVLGATALFPLQLGP